MMIQYRCTKCGTILESPDSMVGQEDKCPLCGQVCVVPAPMPRGNHTVNAQQGRKTKTINRMLPALAIVGTFVVFEILFPPWRGTATETRYNPAAGEWQFCTYRIERPRGKYIFFSDPSRVDFTLISAETLPEGSEASGLKCTWSWDYRPVLIETGVVALLIVVVLAVPVVVRRIRAARHQ